MKKKTLVLIACSFIGIIILLLIVLWLMSKTHHKYYTYDEVENKIIDAAKTFHKENPDLLPTEEGRTSLSYNTLVENGYIAPLNELLEDGDSCSADISVIKSGINFTYIPKLTCSDKYSSIDIKSKIMKDFDVVTEGSGLYSDGNGGYYFRGKVTNNFVQFGRLRISEKETQPILWRLIAINEDGSLRLKAVNSLENAVPFDTRYNETRESNVGYNDFELSTIKDYLKKLEKDENFLSESQKAKIVKQRLCIDTRKMASEINDGSDECEVMSQDEYMYDLLKPYEYIRVSLDENCKNLTDRSCQNFNFLAGQKKDSWTLIPLAGNNYQSFIFNGMTFEEATCSKSKYIYPVINLSPYVMFASGEGTLNNPYAVK